MDQPPLHIPPAYFSVFLSSSLDILLTQMLASDIALCLLSWARGAWGGALNAAIITIHSLSIALRLTSDYVTARLKDP